MSRYTSRRNIRKFWENPLANLCFTGAILAFVAGVFGLFAVLGGADALLFAIIAIVIGVVLVWAGKKTYRKK